MSVEWLMTVNAKRRTWPNNLTNRVLKKSLIERKIGLQDLVKGVRSDEGLEGTASGRTKCARGQIKGWKEQLKAAPNVLEAR